MIARATLALILAGPALASGLTLGGGTAAATTLPRKATSNGHVGSRDKMAQASPRRLRHAQVAAARPVRRDGPAAIVATLDDGLAFDTPRDATGHPLPETASGTGTAHAWQVGTASWYGGPQWQGRRMTDGSRYEQDQLTAAHLSLPLGSLVRVSLVGEDRSVVVRITDRPGTRRRVIDLSRAAAAQLGMLSMGVAQVRLDPL